MRIIIALSLLLACLSLHAQADLNWFVGSWQFGLWNATNASDIPDLTATWILESGLDSATALTGHVVINGSTFTRELINYDPQARQYKRTIAANDGSYYVFTSRGWNDERLTWMGTQHTSAGSVTWKAEMQKQDAAHFVARYYKGSGGAWTLIYTERLARVAP